MTQNTPIHLRPVVYTLPSVADVQVDRDIPVAAADGTTLLLDAYRPPHHTADTLLPAVLFIHGGPVPPERDMKTSGQYRSWGALAAVSGFVGLTFNHRYHEPALLAQSLEDVQAVIDYVRSHAARLGLDAARLCVWACSGGGPHLSLVLWEQPANIRCAVGYYPVLDPQAIPYLQEAVDAPTLARSSPLALLHTRPLQMPLLLVRAGRDHPVLNETIDAFVAQALAQNSPIEVINHVDGQHGFDVADDMPRSRQIIARTLAFLQEHA